MPVSSSIAKASKAKQQQVATSTSAIPKTTSKQSTTLLQPPSNIVSQVVPSAGFLVTCDSATKQFIKFLDKAKSADKKVILEDLDATHLLIDGRAKDEILRKIEAWQDENVFTNVERVGENLET